MDKLYRKAIENKSTVIKNSYIDELSSIGDVLTVFLDEQLNNMSNAEQGEAVLKRMISASGTKRRLLPFEILEDLKTTGVEMDETTLQNILHYFINVRIITEKDENGYYELRHDSLASRIYERMTAIEKEIIEVKKFIENEYYSFTKWGKLLDEKDLKYLAAYESLMFLNENIVSFIKQSKNKIKKAKQLKRNIFVIAASIIIVSLTIFGIYTYKAQKKAELEAKIQKSISLANSSLLNKDTDATLAYLLAEKAYKIYPTDEALGALINAYKMSPFYNQITGNEFIFSPSGKYILTTSIIDNTINIYDYTGKLLSKCIGHKGQIHYKRTHFSDDEKFIISESLVDSSKIIWNINGKLIKKYKLHPGEFSKKEYNYDFKPDKRIFLNGYAINCYNINKDTVLYVYYKIKQGAILLKIK